MLKVIVYFNSRKLKWHIFYKSVICFTNTSERVYWMEGMKTSLDTKIIWWTSWAKLIKWKEWIALKIKNDTSLQQKSQNILYMWIYNSYTHI